MERFNTTKKGYRFDKIIFWSIVLLIFVLLGFIFNKYGTTYKPYLNCKGPGNCENPFANELTHGCSWGFGLMECKIERENWMDEEMLSPGEYGTKPINAHSFFLIIIGLFLFGLIINHFIWNRGKKFHLDIIDKIEKLGEK